jgi:hypothetical protein
LIYNNQNIYHRPANLDHLIEVPPLTLWENCRNTQAIHRAVSILHHNPRSLACRGPEGRAPETYFYSDTVQQERRVQEIFHRLVHEERIAASQIVLLTTRAPDKTPFPYNKKLGNFKLIDINWAPAGLYDVRVSSVHRFKGLESRVVIVAGMEDNDPTWLNPLLYVACSRARTHLILVAHERAHTQIELLLSQSTPRGTR